MDVNAMDAAYILGVDCTPLWYQVLSFTGSMTAIRVMICGLQTQTHSIWTGVVVHASHNVFLMSFYGQLLTQGAAGDVWCYVAGECGLFQLGCYNVMAVIVLGLVGRQSFDAGSIMAVSQPTNNP